MSESLLQAKNIKTGDREIPSDELLDEPLIDDDVRTDGSPLRATCDP